MQGEARMPPATLFLGGHRQLQWQIGRGKISHDYCVKSHGRI
jgi:hypothetical protein